jgi:endonuclease-3
MPRKIPVDLVLRKLKRLYKPPATFLHWKKPLDLLVASILSARCTDARVNIVTKTLFAKYKTAEEYVRAPRRELEHDIHSCGTYKNKAKFIQESCRMLLRDFGGRVPGSMEELLRLPGVGRKIAAVILQAAFKKYEGIAVDTHVLRLTKRLQLSRERTQATIERDLMAALPRKEWGNINTYLISHGRAICTAYRRKCDQCVFQKECPSSFVMGRPDLAQ